MPGREYRCGIGHSAIALPLVTAPNCREAAVLLLLCIIGAIHQLANAVQSTPYIRYFRLPLPLRNGYPREWVANCRAHHAKNRQWVPSTTGKRRPLQNKQVFTVESPQFWV